MAMRSFATALLVSSTHAFSACTSLRCGGSGIQQRATFAQQRQCRSPAPLLLEPALEPAAKVTFEAQGDPAQLAVLLFVVAAPAAYWWFVTVPEARLGLAKDKRVGEVNDYLQELQSDESGERAAERWFLQKWLKQTRPAKATPSASAEHEGEGSVAAATEAPPAADDPVVDPLADLDALGRLRVLFAPAKNPGTPSFFSGDNPIVVAMGTLLALGAFAAAARENQQLAIDGTVLLAGLVFGASRLTLK